MSTSPLSASFVVAVALAAAGCQQSRQVGSSCPNGVCPLVTGVTDSNLQCSVSSVVGEIRLQSAPGASNALQGLCLPRPLLRDRETGLVDCELSWDLFPDPLGGPEARVPCEETDLGGEDDTGTACLVHQLALLGPDAGVGLEGMGWFYEEATDASDGCFDGGPRVTFTHPERMPDSTVRLSCATAIADPAVFAPELQLTEETVPVDPAMCSGSLGPTSNVDVGSFCRPALVPEGGFDDREVHVETPHPACETDVCLTYRLRGDPRAECGLPSDGPGPLCASFSEVENRNYCSCRCALEGEPPGEQSGCTCLPGFSCVPALQDGPDHLRGSYCVKNGTFTVEG